MGRSVQQALPPMEVKPSHRDEDARAEAVKELHPTLRMAKAKAGRAFERAIGDRPLKEFGHEGLVSAVCSGEKVPDYFARIVEDKATRRRFALALLEDDTDVVMTMHISLPLHKKVG